MSEVWLVETGEYEERQVFAVATSPEVALAHIRNVYSPPYRVRWEEPVESERGFTLTGHFEHVTGYSTQHSADFDITPEDLIDG